VRADRQLAPCAAATCSRPAEFGAWFALSPAPAAGWRFAGWRGPCASVAGTCVVQAGRSARAVATFVRA
jgi:hypothetical protein